MYFKIRQEFEHAKQTRKLAEPRPEDIQAVGWAKPGNSLSCGFSYDFSIKNISDFI